MRKVDKATLPNEQSSAKISDLLALSTFLTKQSSTLYGHSFPEHLTIVPLYHVAKNLAVLDVAGITSAVSLIQKTES